MVLFTRAAAREMQRSARIKRVPTREKVPNETFWRHRYCASRTFRDPRAHSKILRDRI